MIGHLPRSVLIGFAVLLWATLVAAWLVPPLLDWSRYRSEISAIVSGELDESLVISGQVRLVLLPQPLLVADDVAISDVQDGLSMRAQELRLRVAFWPLLAGRVDAQELVLHGLDLHLAWPLGALAGRLQVPSWLSSIAASIEGGTVSIGGLQLTHLDATLGLLPETGALALNGTTQIGSLKLRLGGHLTRQGGDGASGLDIMLDGIDAAQGLGANFTGQLAANGGLSGHVAAHGPNLGLLLPAPALAFRSEAALTVAGPEVAAKNIVLDIAGTTARGAGSYQGGVAPHLNLALAANRLDLDAWATFLLHGTDAGLPGVATSLDVSVEAATLAGATLRQLRGGFDINQDQLVLRESSAILPGEARLQLGGQLRRANGSSDLHFDGTGALHAPALQTTLAWLQTAGVLDMSALPAGILRSADLRAAVVVDGGTPPVFALSELNGMIDQTHVQGGLTLRPGPRLGLSAKLDLDHVSLDSMLPLSPLTLAGLPARFGKLDFDVQLRAGDVLLGGRSISPVQVDAALEPGKFTLRRFEAQLPGARVTMAGVVGADGKISDGRLDLSALPEAQTDLLGWLPASLAAHWPKDRLQLNVQASGPPTALALHLVGDLGDLHADLQPVVNLTAGSWRGTLALRHPGAPRLIAALGWPNPVSWLGSGSFSVTGVFTGTGLAWPPQSLASDGFDLAAGQLRATGALTLTQGEVPNLTGRIKAETLPLPLPVLRSTDPLPVDRLAGWQASVKLEAKQVLGALDPELQNLTTMLTLQNGTLNLDAITANLDDGSLTGHASLTGTAQPPAISAELALTGAHPTNPIFTLPLDLSGGVVDGSLSLQASGYAPQTMLATLGGQLHLTQHDGTLLGIDLARMGPRLEEADLRAALANGSTAIDRAEISATLLNGAAQLGQSFATGPSGRVDITGLFDIVGRTQELHLTLTPSVPEPPVLGLRISGSLDTPVRNAELLDAPRWRAEHLPPPEPPVPQAVPNGAGTSGAGTSGAGTSNPAGGGKPGGKTIKPAPSGAKPLPKPTAKPQPTMTLPAPH